MKKKTNPRHRPATQADLKKAKREAAEEAVRRLFYLMIYIFIEKHNAPKEELLQLGSEFNYYADSINRDYVTWRDIEKVVVEDYGVTVPW